MRKAWHLLLLRKTRFYLMFKVGEWVTINNKIGVVVLTGDQLPGDMADHTGVWFGTTENGVPEVWTIPTEYLAKGPDPILKH